MTPSRCCWLICWRRVYFRFFRQRASPGRAQQRKQVAINAIVASDTPGQDDEQRQEAKNRVRADGSGQQVVKVHHQTEEGGNACQTTNNQTNTNQQLPKGDEVCPDCWMRDNKGIQKAGIPALHCWMISSGFANSALRKAKNGCSAVVIEDPGASRLLPELGSDVNRVPCQFLVSGNQPLITNIQPNNEP